ncbi:MAG: transcriptional regulator [Elusimicrobia bacterium HGW-Elusimicrobia-1]|jgi:predicted HTH transcriptional regulator|nr:MAG: transcriptional regulator [Elusimicrobia bacterium HGW-Elusimicrobia-1]
MAKHHIFISGSQKELGAERRAVKDSILGDVLLSEYFDVFLFEDAPAKGRPDETAYLDEVRKSDIYIGILGDRYGAAGKNKISPTETEFHAAKAGDKDILIYIKGAGAKDKNRELGVQKLIKEIKNPAAGYCYRRFDSVEELTGLVYESLINFLKEKGDIGRAEFDRRICDGAGFADIDDEKVKWFLNVARRMRNFPLGLNSTTQEVFTHLKLFKDGKLTNAAVLLFGKEPRKFFDQANVKCIQLPSTEVEKPFVSYQIYDGNLFEQVDKAVGFVLDILKFPVIQQEHTTAVARPREIPVFAIREAIVNAVAHRDYNAKSSVQVMVFLDRVEIWNSGSLPIHLKIDDLKKPHGSHPSNPLFASAMYLADYIQQAGSGTLEMLKQCKEHGLPEPQFVSVRNLEFKTILARDLFTEDALSRMGLNERQLKAVKYVKQNGRITNTEYQRVLTVSKRQATNDLNELEKKEILSRFGKTGRGTFYTLRGTKGAKGAPKGH